MPYMAEMAESSNPHSNPLNVNVPLVCSECQD